jgi:hypothetical protein
VVPHADQFVGVGIREGLEQYAFDDAEDNGVGAYADGERDESDGREQGSSGVSPKNLFELIEKVRHESPPLGLQLALRGCYSAVVLAGTQLSHPEFAGISAYGNPGWLFAL